MGDFISVSLNFIFYLGIFVIALRKNHKFGAIEVLLSMYAVVAFFGIILYQQAPETWHFNILYFIYLFVVFLICIRPVLSDNRIEVKEMPIKNTVFYRMVSWVFILLSFYSCTVYLPQVVLILTNPDWAELYADSHDTSLASSTSKIANAFFHIRYLGIVLFFSTLVDKRTGSLFKILLGLASFLPVVLVTLTKASRGGMVALVISLFLTFMIFRPLFSKKTIRKILFAAAMLVPFAFVYFMAVSSSRFEVGPMTVEDSFLDYVGQSMLYFNYGVMDSITGYGWGGYMFDIADRIKMIKGAHFGSGFITYVGCLYIDYGFIGTLLITLLVSGLISRVIRSRRHMGIPELFLLITYLMYLFNGVFVVPPSYGQQWIEAIFIYIVLRFSERAFNFKKPSYENIYN